MYSEAEMKTFFQGVVDQVATLSTQAAQVEGLRQSVHNLNERVSQLEADNRNLVDQLQNAQATMSAMEQQCQDLQTVLEGERNARQGLQDTIVQRDSAVSELTNNLNTERDAHRITLSERDDARQVIEERNTDLGNVRGALDQVTVERNEWRNKAIDLEGENASLKQRLDRITAILNPPQPVSYPSADVA